jgi:hypothetical protein
MAASAENLHLMDGAMLSRTLRTLVRLGQKPNASWLYLLAEESYYHLSRLQPQQLADFVWAFGQLRYSPGPRWLARAVEAAAEQLPGFNASAMVRLLQGLAWVSFKPEAEWLGSVGFRVQQLLGEMTAQELLQIVAALERLGLGPGTVLIQQLSAGALSTPTAAQAYAAAAVTKAAAASVSVQTALQDVVKTTTAVPPAAAKSSSGFQDLQQVQLSQPLANGEVGLPPKLPLPLPTDQHVPAPGHAVPSGSDGIQAVPASQTVFALQPQQETASKSSTDARRNAHHRLETVISSNQEQCEGADAPVLLLPRPQRPQRPISPLQLPLAAPL